MVNTGSDVIVAVGDTTVAVASGLGSTPVNISAATTPMTARMTMITPQPTNNQVSPAPVPPPVAFGAT
jgi:hypothetical protein